MHDAFHPKPLLGLLTEVVFDWSQYFSRSWRISGVTPENFESGRMRLYATFVKKLSRTRKQSKRGGQYHEALRGDIESFLQSDAPKALQSFYPMVHFHGLEPVTFERSAWDLALATQSLSYFAPKLAYVISRVYTRQAGASKAGK